MFSKFCSWTKRHGIAMRPPQPLVGILDAACPAEAPSHELVLSDKVLDGGFESDSEDVDVAWSAHGSERG